MKRTKLVLLKLFAAFVTFCGHRLHGGRSMVQRLGNQAGTVLKRTGGVEVSEYLARPRSGGSIHGCRFPLAGCGQPGNRLPLLRVDHPSGPVPSWDERLSCRPTPTPRLGSRNWNNPTLYLMD